MASRYLIDRKRGTLPANARTVHKPKKTKSSFSCPTRSKTASLRHSTLSKMRSASKKNSPHGGKVNRATVSLVTVRKVRYFPFHESNTAAWQRYPAMRQENHVASASVANVESIHEALVNLVGLWVEDYAPRFARAGFCTGQDIRGLIKWEEDRAEKLLREQISMSPFHVAQFLHYMSMSTR